MVTVLIVGMCSGLSNRRQEIHELTYLTRIQRTTGIYCTAGMNVFNC